MPPDPGDDKVESAFTKDEIEALKKLAKWSEEDLNALRLMARYWAGIGTVSKGLGNLGKLGQWAMYIYAVYVALKFGVLDQFLVGKPPK